MARTAIPRSSGAGVPGADLLSLLDEVQTAADRAQKAFATAAAELPSSGFRFLGQDESDHVEVTIDHRLRVVDLRVNEPFEAGAERDEEDDVTESEDAEGVEQEISRAVLGAYHEAVAAAFDSTAPERREQVIPAPNAPEEHRTPVSDEPIAYVMPGQWPTADRYEQWAQLRQRADRAFARVHAASVPERLEGRDAQRRVTVAVTGTGALQGVEIEPRWADGVGRQALVTALREALDDAYAHVDSANHDKEA